MATIPLENNQSYVRDIATRAVLLKDKGELVEYNTRKNMIAVRNKNEESLRYQLNTLIEKVKQLSKTVEDIKK